MGRNKFLLKVEGENFVISMQGEGNAEAAKTEVSKAFGGLPVSVLNFGNTEPSEIDYR